MREQQEVNNYERSTAGFTDTVGNAEDIGETCGIPGSSVEPGRDMRGVLLLGVGGGGPLDDTLPIYHDCEWTVKKQNGQDGAV